MPKATSFSSFSAPFLLAVLAVLAAAFLNWATPDGPSIHPDSVVYLGAAHNIAAGKGYAFSIPPEAPTPLTHYPPGYSLVLAASDAIFGDIYRGARAMSLLLFGLGVWLAGMVAWQASGRKLAAGLVGAGLYAANPVMFDLHACAISESLFLPLTLLCALCTMRSVETGHSGDLIAAGLTAGLAAATRYSGFVWIAAVPLSILLASGKDWRTRFKRALIAGSVALLPVLALIVRNKLAGGATTNREFGVHLVSAAHLKEALITMSSWLFPWRFSTPLTGLLAAAAVAALLFVPAWRAWRSSGSWDSQGIFALIMGVFSALYLVHLPVAITFLDFSTPMDSRLLAPVEMLALCALVVAVTTSRHRPWLGYAAVLVLVAFQGRQSFVLARRTRVAGSGYRSRSWYASPAIRAIRALPISATLWSNKPEGIYVSLGLPARVLPAAQDPYTLKPNTEAARQLEGMVREAASTPAYVVYFHSNQDDFQFSGGEQTGSLGRLQDFPIQKLKTALNLQEIVAGADATLFSIGTVPVASSERTP